MFRLDVRAERIAAAALLVLMASTRIHHFGVGAIAPDAATAVFFLGGLLLGGWRWFAGFALTVFVLDAIAIGPLQVEAVCVSWGYGLLLPAFAALWLAGRQGRAIERLDVVAAAKLAGLAIGGVAVYFVISNLGYYYGADYHISMGAAEFTRRVSRYFPAFLLSTLFYSAAGVAIVLAARGFRATAPAR